MLQQIPKLLLLMVRKAGAYTAHLRPLISSCPLALPQAAGPAMLQEFRSRGGAGTGLEGNRQDLGTEGQQGALGTKQAEGMCRRPHR